MTGAIDTAFDDGICTVTIENDGRRNALSYSMVADLADAFDSLAADDDEHVVVLTGAGEEAFSAGFDLTTDRSERTDAQRESWPRMIAAIEGHDYPTIAMLNGHTYGGAVEVAAACDLRIGVRDATFGITPAKIGLVYGGDAIARVMALVGPAKTKELLFTGEGIDAEHAYEIGLLNYVEERDALEARTYAIAETIASNAPLSLVCMKRIVGALLAKGRLTDAERRWIARLRDEAFASDDHTEGVAAFDEGRDPEFTGR